MTISHTSGIDVCSSHKPIENMERQPAGRPKQSPGRWIKKDRKDGKLLTISVWKLHFSKVNVTQKNPPVCQNHDKLGEKSEKNPNKTKHCFNCVVKELYQETWSAFRNKGKLFLKRALLVPAQNYLLRKARISPCISRVVNSPPHPHKCLRDLSLSMERAYFNIVPFRNDHSLLPWLCHNSLHAMSSFITPGLLLKEKEGGKPARGPNKIHTTSERPPTRLLNPHLHKGNPSFPSLGAYFMSYFPFPTSIQSAVPIHLLILINMDFHIS